MASSDTESVGLISVRGSGQMAPGLALAGLKVAPWAVMAAGALALAALSLLLPSAPTYDPWAWIIWGREIAHLDLQTTGGPSWKPLPVMFTTVFSLFGSAAPELWLLVARAGALFAVVPAFLLARRLGGGPAGGVAAAAGLLIAPWFVRNAWYGNSEPLLIALLLGAMERELAGKHKIAFGLGVAVALLRPEAWPFLALYSLWLIRRRELHWLVVTAVGGAVIALWTLPELWGSGDLLRAAHRAQAPNADAATFAENPALQVFIDSGEMLAIPVIAGLVALLGFVVVRRLVLPVGLLAFALGWTGLVAYMTASEGFSGNQRYLMPAVAVMIVLAGAGAGMAAAWLPRKALPVAIVALGVAFAATGALSLDRTTSALRYQANLVNALPGLIERAGGAERLRSCGHAYTGPFLVPAVAWHLGVHTFDVGLKPRTPAVVFRERTTQGRNPVPPMYEVRGRNLALADNWRIVADSCPA